MKIREVNSVTEYFVGTCTHVAYTPAILAREEMETSSKKRIAWLQKKHRQGSRVKVAILDGQPVGFIHLMPIEIGFFEKHGFHVRERKDKEALLWKVFDTQAKAPSLFKRNYYFKPTAGEVVVDLFWNTFCPTSSIEAQKVFGRLLERMEIQ